MADIPSKLGETPVEDNWSARDEDAAFKHKERFQRVELGLLGRFFGSEKEKPGNIAGLTLIVLLLFLGISAVGWLVSCTSIQPCTGDEAFQAIFAGFMSVITLILGYLFGSRR